MAAGVSTLTVRIHVAWWLRLYLYALIILCTLTDMQPNQERMTYWITKGLCVRARPTPRTVQQDVRRTSLVLGVVGALSLACTFVAWWQAFA